MRVSEVKSLTQLSNIYFTIYKMKKKDHGYRLFVIVSPFLETVFEGGTVAVPLGYVDNAGVVKDNTPDSETAGRYVQYIKSKDDKGRDVATRYVFSEGLRRLQTRATDHDIYGKNQYDFLKNSPFCEGSPNGTYEDDGLGGKIQTGVMYREFDDVRDAKTVLDADRIRLRAELTASELDDTTLEEVANLTGYYGDIDDKMRIHVLTLARKNPAQFNKIFNSADRPYRAIIRKAVQEHIFTTKGSVIIWDTFTVGADEDSAVATLMKDKDILSALEEKLGIKVPKKAGRPVGTTKKAEEQVSL